MKGGKNVSFVIMNMGTGGDVANIEGVIAETRRILSPGGMCLFSFYNAESLQAKLGFFPWPMPLAALIDPERRCLEVYHHGEVYLIYARPYTTSEVKKMFSDGFEVAELYTYPTVSSILPECLLTSEEGEGRLVDNREAQDALKKIDKGLALSGSSYGAYILAVCRKL